jgi:long-chain fatty acid transport protein
MILGERLLFAAPLSKLTISLLQVILLLLVGSLQSTGKADGFRNPFQSAAAIAQGNAFAAQADDASAVFYNPAGTTQLRGTHHLGGVELVNVDTRFRGRDGRTTENDLAGLFGFPPPLQLFVTATPHDLGVSWSGDLNVGFELQNLFGFAARYPKDGPLNNHQG